MRVERSTIEHLLPWAALRAALWPDYPTARHRDEASRLFLSGNERAAAFIGLTCAGDVIAFAEATLRSDHVNGCQTSPVLFLEGIYVQPAHRRQGMARRLCEATAAWGLSKGCTEFASDALLDNHESHEFHAAFGFTETERTVFFRKIL